MKQDTVEIPASVAVAGGAALLALLVLGLLTSCGGGNHAWPHRNAACKSACEFGGATRHSYDVHFGCQCADDNGNLWQVQRCN